MTHRTRIGSTLSALSVMAVWSTFLVEHLLYGLTLGVVAALASSSQAPARERATTR